MHYHDAIKHLKDGNQRFLNGQSNNSSDLSLRKLKEFAEIGQSPKAIILCCSDSRAPAEIVFDQDIGDLFVIRVAGNIVAPSLVGSVEFAVSTFGTELVVVMGHTKCGAITSTLQHIQNTQAIATENLHDIVSRIKPHIYTIAQMDNVSQDDKMKHAVEANVLASVAQLSHSSRLIEGRIKQGKMKIIGSVLDIDTGIVRFLDI